MQQVDGIVQLKERICSDSTRFRQWMKWIMENRHKEMKMDKINHSKTGESEHNWPGNSFANASES